MSQYEDIVQRLKQMKRKGSLEDLKKISKNEIEEEPIEKTKEKQKEEKKKEKHKKKEVKNEHKEKIKKAENKKDNVKEKPKISEPKKEEPIKIEPVNEEIIKSDSKDYSQELQKNGFDLTQEESAEFEICPDFKINVKWSYYLKKKTEETKEEEKVYLELTTSKYGKIILHWGVYKPKSGNQWIKPPSDSLPLNTKEIDKMSAETLFPNDINEKRVIKILLPRGEGYSDYIAGFNFVIYDPIENIWYNNNRQDYRIKFKLRVDKTLSKMILNQYGLYVPEYVEDIINCEANYGEWTLMHRYNKCSEIINDWDSETENEDYVWILIWLRYSYQRQLDWQRNYNTRPAQLSGSMNHLSNLLTQKYIEAFQKETKYSNLSDSKVYLIKFILSLLGKGTGNGQEIRDEILKVMHRNGICKNPIGNFYEQWHQKLHNNTTPEDITICEAVINFLRSKGDKNVYWKTLKEGGITKERLASYERNIVDEPWYNASYNIWDFENYLRILKSVHASTDLIQTYDQCKYIIGNNSKLDDIIKYKNDQNVINQIRRVAEGREVLLNIIKNNLNNCGKLRDVLFFELSLEVYVRQLVEKAIHIKLSYYQYIEEITLVLRNIKISFPNYSEFLLCYKDWEKIVLNNKVENQENALKIKSVVSRLKRLLSNVVDYYNQHFNSRAKFFGKECEVDNYASEMFAEELMRGSIFFALSMLVKKIEPTIRQNANLSDWLIISRGKENSINGKLLYIKNLHEVQFEKYKEKTIIVTEVVSGNEEIPENCIGLIIIKSENYPDVLAHVSVRARNLNVPFVVCFNENISNDLLKYINKNIEVSFKNQEISFNENNKSDDKAPAEKETKKKNETIELVIGGNTYKKIYLELDDFDENSVGAKSNNTKKIFKSIPDCDFVKYPESFSIPFNVPEYFLGLDENKEIKEDIDEYISKIKLTVKKEEIRELLEKCRDSILNINFVINEETNKLKKKLIEFGIEENQFDLAFNAIKKVWASKFNERVFIATSKVNISLYDIKMSVLCQKIIPAEYAYVIHTKNPCNNNKNEVFAEVCNGMGEALVGAYEGEPFSFVYYKDKNNYEIKSFPNKSVSLQNKGFIFRSDSNTEDLEGFSGAGLFDSVPMIEDKKVEMDYSNDKLFTDKSFLDNMIKKISQLGIGVEKLYGNPQDIEGVFYDNNFYIVQTRPQV